MKDFLRKFTHEATIHRSFFKHWKETADQVTNKLSFLFFFARLIKVESRFASGCQGNWKQTGYGYVPGARERSDWRGKETAP